MKSSSTFIKTLLSMILPFYFLSIPGSSAQVQNAVPKLTVDGNTAARFFFKPPNANFILPALIYRVADVGSPNWNTAPIDPYGRSAYISLSEMQSLVHHLDSDGILRKVSATTSSLAV